MDELLAETLTAGGLDFAARSLHYIHPSNRTVRAIADAALRQSVHCPVDVRISVSPNEVVSVDTALMSCAVDSSPANLPIVEQVLIERLDLLLRNRELGAAFVLEHLIEHGNLPRLREALVQQHSTTLIEFHHTAPWAAIVARTAPAALRQIIENSGVLPLYRVYQFHENTVDSAARQFLVDEIPPIAASEEDLVALALTRQPTPWMSEYDIEVADVMALQLYSRAGALHLLLTLPMLERENSRVGTMDGALATLAAGRRNQANPAALAQALSRLRHVELPWEVGEFLRRWMRGEISVLGPVPGRPH